MEAVSALAILSQPGTKITTCPLTENGVTRVLKFPGYGRRGGLELNALRERLRQACDELDHEFWPDDISLRDDSLVDFARVHGHQQITDVYLLSLAVKHRGCLATIDRAVELSAVVGAQPRHLKVL